MDRDSFTLNSAEVPDLSYQLFMFENKNAGMLPSVPEYKMRTANSSPEGLGGWGFTFQSRIS